MIKFILVLIMSGLHGYFSYCWKKLIHNNSFYSPKYLKYLNEVPTVLMIVIVIMVIVRPFN
jgi:putative membrane protein